MKPATNFNIALMQVLNKGKKYALNKDLNGGFGTADDYGDSFTSKLISLVKWRAVRIPIIGMAFLQALLKEKGNQVKYYEGDLPSAEEQFDLMLIYGSIVDCHHENAVASQLKKDFPSAKIGFFGTFPSRFPEVFSNADFVLSGEAEAFFMNDFKSLDQLTGVVKVSSLTDIEALPTPDFTGFPVHKYSYFPCLSKRPFVSLLASKGCPYSCKYYCTYGEYQGPKIRQRSAKKVVDDILHVQQKYGVKSVQFRDPVFGLVKTFIPQFCEELKSRGVKINWGMETRLDLLNEGLIKMMFGVGLRNINVGIETKIPEVAEKNKRLLIKEPHQEKIIQFCSKLGVKISAFYILAYEGDTRETIRETINYAKKLNTNVARFSVSTPFPGTGFYLQLEQEGRILTKDWEKYTLHNLVYKHQNFSPQQVKELLGTAFKEYYFRPRYALQMLQWRIRELWL